MPSAIYPHRTKQAIVIARPALIDGERQFQIEVTRKTLMVRVKGSTKKETNERIEQVFELYKKGVFSHEAAKIVGRDISMIRRYYKILEPRMKSHRDKRWAAMIRWTRHKEKKRIQELLERARSFRNQPIKVI